MFVFLFQHKKDIHIIYEFEEEEKNTDFLITQQRCTPDFSFFEVVFFKQMNDSMI